MPREDRAGIIEYQRLRGVPVAEMPGRIRRARTSRSINWCSGTVSPPFGRWP
jgi:hypothetical protein